MNLEIAGPFSRRKHGREAHCFACRVRRVRRARPARVRQLEERSLESRWGGGAPDASPEPPMSRPIGLLGGTLTVGEVSVTIPAGALDHDVVASR